MKYSRFLNVAWLALQGAAPAVAQQTQQPGWDCAGTWHMAHGGWGWVFPLFIVFMIVGCAAIFVLGRRSGSMHWRPWQMAGRPAAPMGAPADPSASALHILNERFAKGEIKKQEYEESKAALLSRRPQ